MPMPIVAPVLRRGRTLALLAALAVTVFFPVRVRTQQMEPPRFAATLGFLDTPGYLPFDERLLASLRVAPGFAITVFARPEGNARMMAVGPNGAIYLTRQRQGDVLLMR